MTYIILNDEQARLVKGAEGTIEVRDSAGRHLGYLTHGFTPEEIDEARRRAASDGPWSTTAEVLEHLKSLDGT